MKKHMLKTWIPLVLALLLAFPFAGSAFAQEPVTLYEVSETEAFRLGMTAVVHPEDSTIIDVVVTLKGIREELNAVEFVLNFDNTLVEGVITENGDDMDAFMTVSPMYTMVIGGMELPSSRYEQICSYDGEAGLYACRFVDSIRYPNAKPGQTYQGLIYDGDLVITIPFRIISMPETVSPISFWITEAMATTTEGLICVRGTADTVTVGVGQEDVPEQTVPTEPTEDTGNETLPTEPTEDTGNDTLPTEPTEDTGNDTLPTEPTEDTGNDTLPTEPTEDAGNDTLPTEPTEDTGNDTLPSEPTGDTALTDPTQEPGVENPTEGREEPPATTTAGDTEHNDTGNPTDTVVDQHQTDSHPPKGRGAVWGVVAIVLGIVVGAVAVVVWKMNRKKK